MARQTLLDLADSAINEYRHMSNAFLDFAEGISTKVVWQENVEPVKSPLEYAGILFDSWKRAQPDNYNQIEELIGELKSRVDITREQYVAIANFLEEQVSLISIEIQTHYKAIVEDLSKLCLNLLKCLCWFPENHRNLRKKLGADNSNPEFVRIFESSFNSKSIMLIDHLFFFFELFQKNLTETILESLNVWGKEYELVMGNLTARFDEQMNALNLQKKNLDKVKSIANNREKENLNLTDRSMIVDNIETVQIELAKAILLIAGETTKAVRFSFEFIEKTLNSLVKVFDALNTHSELTLGDEKSQLSPELLDDSLKEYFNIGGELLNIMNARRDFNLQGQLIFDTVLDSKMVHKLINQLFGGWMDHIAPYLQPVEGHSVLLDQLESILKQGTPKNMLMSPEINLFLEVSDEDVNMASIYKYPARISKRGVPCNGTLMLMSEHLIFFYKSIAADVNIILPYRCIAELRQTKNFLGTSNGLNVGTVKGHLEFFLADSKIRDQVLNRLQISVESLRIVTQTSLFESLCFRDEYFWPDSTGHIQTKALPEEHHERMKAHVWRTVKKVNVRYLDLNAPMGSVAVAGAWIGKIQQLLFNDEKVSFQGQEYDNFVHLWVANCAGGCSVSKLKNAVIPQFISNFELAEAQTVKENEADQGFSELEAFLGDCSQRTLVYEYQLPEIGQVIMRLTISCSHLDQFEVNIQANSSKRTSDFEGLLIAYQGNSKAKEADPSSAYLEFYWKQGIKPFDGAISLFGQAFLDLLPKFLQQSTAKLVAQVEGSEEAKVEALEKQEAREYSSTQ